MDLNSQAVSPVSSTNNIGCHDSPAQLQDAIHSYSMLRNGRTLVYGSPPAMSS